MNVKFLFLTILIGTLALPLLNIQIFSIAFAQTSDKSFKGNEAPFIPPPESERIPKAPPSDAISINDRPAVGLEDSEEDEGGEEKDRDMLPPLTEKEIQELPFDNITAPSLTELKIISSNTSFTDPIKSIVEEIIKNDTIISDDNNINSFNSSKIKNKFDISKMEQIFIAQNMSQDLETNRGSNETEMISNTTGDQDDDDNILSTSELPNLDIRTFINNTKVDSIVTEAEEEQPAITDELTTEGRNVTEAEVQNNEDDLQEEGKTITIEEIPLQSEESQTEGAREGNVTLKGPLTVNNTSEDSDSTTSSALVEKDEQEKQTPSLDVTTEETTKNESKMKITEICNDEMDNDSDGIIDEEHECILETSDIISRNEKVVPELATLDDNDKDEEEEKEDNQKKNAKDEEIDKDDDQVREGSISSKNNNKNNVIEKEQTSLEPEIRPDGVEIITSNEICNDEMDNDLDGIIDEKKDCITK
ncbi:MAG TPA: hypothetical protein VJL78_05600 [Candidatus Nitrosocosmicus sp.]|nr:hypothetical protein [Candidatus Nitrosocosmicus sp.]